MLPSGDTSELQRHRQTQSKWVEMILQANSIHRRAILIFDKINLKITKVTRDKDGHFIMIERTLHQKDIILYMHSIREHENT